MHVTDATAYQRATDPIEPDTSTRLPGLVPFEGDRWVWANPVYQDLVDRYLLKLEPIRERGADGNLIARLGDPAQPFYAGADKLLTTPPYPRDLSIAQQQPLESIMNAVVYLGPAPDRSMSHAVDLTRAHQVELARQVRIKGDLTRLMKLRYGHRAEWFRTHPHDIPPRPRPEA